MKVFEISDVVVKDSSKDVGARNERRLCAVYYGKTPGFEIIHGLLDRLMEVLGVKYTKESSDGYYIKAANDPSFFHGSSADVLVGGKVAGQLGILHPEVLPCFELNMPTSVLEINIELFV